MKILPNIKTILILTIATLGITTVLSIISTNPTFAVECVSGACADPDKPNLGNGKGCEKFPSPGYTSYGYCHKSWVRFSSNDGTSFGNSCLGLSPAAEFYYELGLPIYKATDYNGGFEFTGALAAGYPLTPGVLSTDPTNPNNTPWGYVGYQNAGDDPEHPLSPHYPTWAWATDTYQKVLVDGHHINTSYSSVTRFCWSESYLKARYSSKSQVYSPKTGKTVSSDYRDGYTGELLQISAKPGEEVEVYFNHYLKSSSEQKASTIWNVSLVEHHSYSGVQYTDISDGNRTATSYGALKSGRDSGTLETTDTKEHSVISRNGDNNDNRKIKVKIPAAPKNESVNDYVEICERINYLKDKDDTDPSDNYTYVCARINVGQSYEERTETCPLPFAKPPAAGTEAYGSTESFSGVKSDVFTTYQHSIYAKPTDNVTFAHCVYPEGQAAMYSKVTHPHVYLSGSSYTEYIYNEYVTNSNWFTITSDNVKVRSSDSGIGVILDPSQYTFSSPGSFSISGNGGRVVRFTGTPHSTASALTYSASNKPYNVKHASTGSGGGKVTQTVNNSDGVNTHSNASDSWTCDRYWYTPPCPSTATSCSRGGWVYVSCTHSWYAASKGANSKSDAYFYVPYNFTTATTSNISQTNTKNGQTQVIIPGEKYSVSATVSILPRSNGTTQGVYATEPPASTRAQVVTFFLTDTQGLPTGSSSSAQDPCSYYSGRGGNECAVIYDRTRNSWMSHLPDLDSGSTYSLGSLTRTAQNLPVGYKICSATGISNTDSKNDTNDNGAGNVTDRWNISSPSCRTIARVPSTQIWGGSLFTYGNVKTSSTTNAVTGRTYGSWDEFALIAGDTATIRGMASGAALGYDNSYVKAASAYGGVGGNPNSAFYLRTPLSIVNKDCNEFADLNVAKNCNEVKKSGISSNSTIMQRLISRYISNAANNGHFSSGLVNLADTQEYQNQAKNYRLTTAKSNISIYNPFSLAKGITHIIYSTGDINIVSNLTYATGDADHPYRGIDEIPQYVIIAEGNINIDPDVTQVDAWLISSKTIDTCTGSMVGSLSTHAASCGNRLVVNGPIVANSITPDRSFGAGAQESSGQYHRPNGTPIYYNDSHGAVSAEVFNLTLDSYLWAYAQALNNPQAYTVYSRQLAPRL